MDGNNIFNFSNNRYVTLRSNKSVSILIEIKVL